MKMKILLSLLLFLIGLFSSSTAEAADDSAKRVLPIPPTPPVSPQVRMFIADSSLKPIELRKLEINSEVFANISNTVIDMTFFNPNTRVLEGELQFPLMNNQTVTGFSLEMENGKMRDAVPVEKAKGREVFEEIVRRGVDPALLEMTSGNNFKLRVYPLSPGKTRRVRVVISELMTEEKDNLIYCIPLEYGQKIGELDLSLKIAHKAKPIVKSSPFDVFDVERKDGNWIYRVNNNAPVINDAITMEIPLQHKEEGKRLYTGIKNGKSYFYAEVPINENAKVNTPNRVDILWDASASGKVRNIAKELSFLEAFFAKVRDVSASLIIVRNLAEPVLNFEIKDGNWKELRSVLEKVIYDGATNLGAFMDLPNGADMKLLFSDGLDNFSIKKLRVKAPLFAIVSSAGSDINSLRHLAKKSGGAFLDLTVSDAQTALEHMNYRAESFSFDGSASDVVWNISGKLLKIAGIVNDKKTPFTVAFNNDKVILDYEDNEYTFVPSIWATMKVSDLEAEYDINKAEIRRIGKAFGLVTRGTSLIVLELVDDYVMNDIEPPAELKAEYDQRIKTRPQRHVEQNKIERVVREWKYREAWWEKDFSKEDIIARCKPESPEMERERLGAAMRLSAPHPSPQESASDINMQMTEMDASPQLQQISPEDMDKAQADEDATTTAITIRQWTSDAPYISRMKDADTEQIYRIYIDERPDYENSPAFYLDVASQLEEKGQKELALRVLSNLVEINLENRQILRVLGYRLMQISQPEFAAVIFKKVLEIGEEEPQSYRDLGLAYEAIGEYQKAVDFLYSVVEKNFSRKFPRIEVIALTEMNKVIALSPVEINTKHIDPRLLRNMPIDLRVVLVWDSDMTGIELNVTDPNDEVAYYGHPLTYQGGRISPDYRTGYGPEEFSLKKAKPGKYTVHVYFYGYTQQAVSESTTIQLDFYTGYGTKEQEKQSVTLRLKERKDRI